MRNIEEIAKLRSAIKNSVFGIFGFSLFIIFLAERVGDHFQEDVFDFLKYVSTRMLDDFIS